MLFFTQTIGAPESAHLARQILDEVSGLNGLVTVEEVNSILDREERGRVRHRRASPRSSLLRDGEDTRLRFLGAPAGYEFASLVEAVLLAGTDDSGLAATSRALLAEPRHGAARHQGVRHPDVRRTARAPSRWPCAWPPKHPLIRATCIEATEFIELSQAYRVTGVPKTVVNDTIEIFGAVPEAEFVRTVVGAPDTPVPPTS